MTDISQIPVWNNQGVNRWKQTMLIKQLKEQAEQQLIEDKITNMFIKYMSPEQNIQPRNPF
jgi:hypothetical protein